MSGRQQCNPARSRSSSARVPSASRRWPRWLRGIEPIVVSDYQQDRRDPAQQSPFDVRRELRAERNLWGPCVVFECVGAAGLIQKVVQSADMARRSVGPPRIIVHPNGDIA